MNDHELKIIKINKPTKKTHKLYIYKFKNVFFFLNFNMNLLNI